MLTPIGWREFPTIFWSEWVIYLSNIINKYFLHTFVWQVHFMNIKMKVNIWLVKFFMDNQKRVKKQINWENIFLASWFFENIIYKFLGWSHYFWIHWNRLVPTVADSAHGLQLWPNEMCIAVTKQPEMDKTPTKMHLCLWGLWCTCHFTPTEKCAWCTCHC